jgi:uncharacterized protein YegL
MWKNLQKGGINNTGTLYIIAIMATIISFGFLMMGGTFPVGPVADTSPPRENVGKQEIVFTQEPDPGKENLQLQTFTIKEQCESKIAVDFLIDVSGSMRFGNKLNEEKAALKAFTDRMVDESVIGIQIFSNPNRVREVVPIGYYKDVKTQVQNTINSLVPDGATSTRDGMALARDKLSGAINANKFPDYKYSLVFLTDGIPETTNPNETDCIATATRDDGYRRCFARAQDPRIPTNIATEIKNLGVKIYSINITSNEKSDVELAPHLESLLQDVASIPISDHYYTSFEGKGLTGILDKVFSDICS